MGYRIDRFLKTTGVIVETSVAASVKIIGILIVLAIFLYLFVGISKTSDTTGVVAGVILVAGAIYIAGVMGRKEYYRKNGIDPVTKKKL
jgi:1,4-dihydroxy-2-naphthoate octaprenyltransferase